MAEKVLRSRRKRASKGRVIRISNDVFAYLNKRRLNNSKLSWDEYFRLTNGLPDRQGVIQPLLEGWLEVSTGKFYFDEADANGAAVMVAARAKTKKGHKPIKLREVI